MTSALSPKLSQRAFAEPLAHQAIFSIDKGCPFVNASCGQVQLVHFKQEISHIQSARFINDEIDGTLANPLAAEVFVDEQLIDKRDAPAELEAETEDQRDKAN